LERAQKTENQALHGRISNAGKESSIMERKGRINQPRQEAGIWLTRSLGGPIVGASIYEVMVGMKKSRGEGKK